MVPVFLLGVALIQPPSPAAPAVRASPAELAEMTQALQKLLLLNTPREIEDRGDWGKTVPIERNMKLMSLRTRIKVGDREELPHGRWTRSKFTLDNPEKDVQILVRDLQTLPSGQQLIHLEITVRCGWEHERKIYNKGIQFAGITARGTTVAQLQVQAEFRSSLDLKQFPPRLTVEAKVKETRVELRDFDVKRFSNLEPLNTTAKLLGDEMRPLVETLIQRKEPELTRAINQALEKVLKKR